MTTEHAGKTSANGRADARSADPSPAPPAPPTDLELMLFFDGELDEPRRTEVERALEAADADRANKLFGLCAVAETVRANAESRAADFSILDGLMASLPEAPDAAPPVATPEIARPMATVAKKPAANDNSKSIFRLALVAVAAAAGFMIYSRMEPTRVASNEPAVTQQTQQVAAPTPAPVPPAVEEAKKPAAEPVEEVAAADEGEGVIVAAVDFGSKSGSVWQAGASTVVWIADPSGEEK